MTNSDITATPRPTRGRSPAVVALAMKAPRPCASRRVFPQLTAKLTRLGAEESVVGLVLPTAYSFNHDGTCLYFAAASVFLAQATDTAISWQQQLGLLLILLVTSKGGAGVSGSALAVLAMTLAATKTIPVESMALILGMVLPTPVTALPAMFGLTRGATVGLMVGMRDSILMLGERMMLCA